MSSGVGSPGNRLAGAKSVNLADCFYVRPFSVCTSMITPPDATPFSNRFLTDTRARCAFFTLQSHDAAQSQAATGNRSCQDRGHWKMGFFLGRSPFLLDCTRSYSTPFHHIHRDDNFMWQRRNDCRVPTHDSYCISCCSFDPVTHNYSVL